MNLINKIAGVLKYAPDKIRARGCGKIDYRVEQDRIFFHCDTTRHFFMLKGTLIQI